MIRTISNRPEKAMSTMEQFKGYIVTPETDYYPPVRDDNEPSVDRQNGTHHG
jgi:hypothetical protein